MAGENSEEALSVAPAPDSLVFFRPAALDDLEVISSLEVCSFRAMGGGAALAHLLLPPAARRLLPLAACDTSLIPPSLSSAVAQAAGYPADEAASRERLEYRLQHGASIACSRGLQC